MSLTRGDGPLSGGTLERVNYETDGPAHRLYAHPTPRRVRALFADETVFDTTDGVLLHETGLLPVLYVPESDFDAQLLEPTERTSHCPFKGDASYWTVAAGGREAQNAIWSYEQPLERASWLRGYRAAYWDAMDSWLEEDEQVLGHLRDPFHRVDARESSRPVRVLAGDEVVAESERAVALFETGLPPRFYLPAEDVRAELAPSETTAVCPYKGESIYRSVVLGDRVIDDAAWTFEAPLEGATKLAGRICLAHAELTVEVDGEPLA